MITPATTDATDTTTLEYTRTPVNDTKCYSYSAGYTLHDGRLLWTTAERACIEQQASLTSTKSETSSFFFFGGSFQNKKELLLTNRFFII